MHLQQESHTTTTSKNSNNKLGIKPNQAFQSNIIELYVTNLHKKETSLGSIRSHLAALRYYATINRLNKKLDSPQLKLLLRGIKRNSQKTTSNPKVVTLKHLSRLQTTSKKTLTRKEHYRFMAMASLAFYGFLRPSEYCRTNSNHHLKMNQAKISKQGTKIKTSLESYKHSKAKKLVIINHAKICSPVKYLKKYRNEYNIKNNTSSRSPLFNITAEQFRKTLKDLCKKANIKTKMPPTPSDTEAQPGRAWKAGRTPG